MRQAVLPHGIAECTGQSCDAAAQCDVAAAGRELVVDEQLDVLMMTEILEPDCAEAGDQVLVGICVVVRNRG
jgi:hypothetical protein